MVKNLKSLLVIFLSVFCCVFIMSGCDLTNNDEKTIEDKTNEEISYLENKILTIFNRYAKGEYGLDDELDWEAIRENVVELNNVLDTIILDLSEIEVSNEEIINFRNGVDSLSIASAQKDINLVLQQGSVLYSLLPKFLENNSENNKNKINIMQLKSFVISSFTYAKKLDWENAKTAIATAENKYKEMMDDVDYMQEYSYNLNKVYVLLGELKNVIDSEELELTKMKYVNFIEKIN